MPKRTNRQKADFRTRNEIIAEDILGWTLVRYRDGEKAKKREDYEAARYNDGYCWESEDMCPPEEAHQWNPDRNVEQALEVAEVLTKRHCQFDILLRQDGFSVVAHDAFKLRKTEEFRGEKLADVLCQAILYAWSKVNG